MNKAILEIATNYLFTNDNVMSRIIKKFGKCNLRPRRQYFNALLKAIVGHQISTAAANAINCRLMNKFNNKPEPKDILFTQEDELKALGLSKAKIRYIKDLSQKILDGEINLKRLSLKDDNEIINELTKVNGIGIWTAHMFLIFTLGRLNVLPYSDLGIKKAIMLNYKLKKLPNSQDVIRLAEKKNWHPYNSVAALYLWKTLENN
ncbi:MAG: hypothetical protein A2V66_06175 [Ignavibacteria bacterium RBG_13_36_8]|nr:MAG: hypothetical protein A2V66_06175 [Ignavibacteria bacterium RBG_13_36_8]